MATLSLIQAVAIADAALARARELGLQPITVTVLDPGGHPQVLKREDGSAILRPNIAYAKAWGTLGMGIGGAALAARAANAPAFYAALNEISGGRMAPSRGGVLIRDGNGMLLGAIGISGDRPERDEECAVFGVQAAGLVAQSE
jgi:uncharacterized protein GlcG (DUF336 family)